MYKELDNKEFDYVIIGTSLCESILSAYLSKSGKKILHLDISKFYGGDYITELKIGRMLDPHLTNVKLISEFYAKEDFFQTEKVREYNFDLNPKFLYGKSRATDELATSRASQYMEFISVKKILLHEDDKFLTVPCSKSEIFMSEDLQLFDKQRLLNFIYAIMKLKNTTMDVNTTIDIKKDYEVENKIYEELKANSNTDASLFLESRFSGFMQNIIKFILANLDPNENTPVTLDKLADNIYKYLNSLQVYDVNPFIYPLYGSSEFSQALCRMSSVLGTIFIVNDTLNVGVFDNNEHLVDTKNTKYAINVFDSNNEETFTLLTDKVIFNSSLVSDKCTNFKLNTLEQPKYENIRKYHQFISFHSIESNSNLRENGCPIVYKVPKNDKSLNNDYGFVVYEFDQNSCSAPKNRTLLQIIITADFNTDISEEEFISKCTKISDDFVNLHLKTIQKKITYKLENLEKCDEETKMYVQSNENILTDVNLLCSFKFYREVSDLHVDYNTKSELVPTPNNFRGNDIDCYYEVCDKIINAKNWQESNNVEVDKNVQINNEEPDYTDNLIDELFDSISIDKK